MGRSRFKIVEETAPHFITCTVLHWLPVFTNTDTVGIVLNSLRFLQAEGLKVYAWVILENHMHLILQSKQLGEDIARFKSYTAKQLLAYLESKNAKTLLDQFKFYKKAHKIHANLQFWQEGVHPEQIQGDEMMRQKIEYIHQNPVKRGYVLEAEHWCNSSASTFSGADSLLQIERVW